MRGRRDMLEKERTKMIHGTDNELVEKWKKGNARVIDDIGDGHEVDLVTNNEDTDSVVLRFHADDGREIETAISKDDVKLDDGKTAKSFGADAILVTPGHVNGDIHENASGIYR
jgi:hypothetical protein